MPACPICATALEPPRVVAPDRLHGTVGQFTVAVCPGCEAGVTLPPVEPAELAAFYPDGYGPYSRPANPIVAAISAAIRRWQHVREPRMAPLDALLDRPPGRGLDVGAGRGDLSAMLQERGWKMTAIEPSEAAAAATAQRGIDARTGVLATVALEPESYDMAVFRHSLEHTIDPVEDLRITRAALRPGGLVLISVPNFGSWQPRRFGGQWYHLDLPRHRVHFTARALTRALEAAGFVVERTATSTSAVGLWATLQYRVFGRCLFPDGLRLRIAAGLCALGLPAAVLADRLGGGGDTLHAVARRPA